MSSTTTLDDEMLEFLEAEFKALKKRRVSERRDTPLRAVDLELLKFTRRIAKEREDAGTQSGSASRVSVGAAPAQVHHQPRPDVKAPASPPASLTRSA